MLARIDTWVFGDIRRDLLGRWCLHYWRNGTKCKRPIHCACPEPIGQELLNTVAEIVGRKLTKCEETDVINLVRIV